MNAQEQQLIDELVDRIRNTAVQNKYAAAEQHLQQGLAGSPDALYILAQTVIVQKYGLEQAQARLQAQQDELDGLRGQAAQNAAKPAGGSFLSNLFGGGSHPAPPPSAAPQGWQPVSNPGYGNPAYPNQGYPQAPPMPSPGPGFGYGQPGGGGGGFLHGALQTAAGVAMGEMAMQSVESLFHGFGGGGYGGGFGRGFEGGSPSETIINNYNDGEPQHEASHDRDDSSFYNPHDDASRDRDTRASFADTDSNDSSSSDGRGSDDSSDDSGDDNSYDSGDDGDSSSGDDSSY